MPESEVREAELPLESVGTRLMRAREAAGMTRSQLAGVTRIPERHLAAIEAGEFAALPARTYAIGFSRSYAKALGMDADSIAEEVRAELSAQSPEPVRRAMPTFEPGDPARVPSVPIVWLAGLGVLAVIAAGFMLWPSMWSPGVSLGSILPKPTAVPAATATAAPAAPSAAGPVVFTAQEAGIWVKFYDGTGKQLMQKQMALGESWTVPADQPQVQIWTGRPEALAITIGGQSVPKLSEVQKTVKDVPVTAAALLARGKTAAAPVGAPPAAAPAPAQALPGTGAALPAPPVVLPAPASSATDIAPVLPTPAIAPGSDPAPAAT